MLLLTRPREMQPVYHNEGTHEITRGVLLQNSSAMLPYFLGLHLISGSAREFPDPGLVGLATLSTENMSEGRQDVDLGTLVPTIVRRLSQNQGP